jgi:hypothetical protein
MKSAIALLGPSMLGALPLPAAAWGDEGHEVSTLDKIIAAAHVRGKILDVRLRGKRYLVKYLDENGQVKVIEIDATSAGRMGRDVID